jgi:16S rRNA (cytosine1402-N4)-methyltransferase
MVDHQPVLGKEVTTYLNCQVGRNYIDCTVGGGGHALRILEKTSPTGRLLGIDWDGTAIRIAEERLKPYQGRFKLVRDNFSNLGRIAEEYGFFPVDGILADLGISSFQLNNRHRGFSFMADGPLDMRMDERSNTCASDLVNGLPARELEKILRLYGEERWARKISRSIERNRQRSVISSTTKLRDIVHAAVPTSFHSRRIDPATKTFMALRIAVNKELENLKNLLCEVPSLIVPGGRVCIISFHSLEDRLVKQHFRIAERGCTCPPDFPQCVCHQEKSLRVLTSKPVLPSRKEISQNPRARSAKLRAAERV